MLYEDENTNRMDEALLLFDQICNHPSFAKTSMILFLNKRDLFAAKLEKVGSMDKWTQRPDNKSLPAEMATRAKTLGKDYDANVQFIKDVFISLNNAPLTRQIYTHATCATDTSNVSFVMDAVFDVILKENLRKLATGNVESMIELATGSGESGVATGPGIWAPDKQGKIILAACMFTSNLSERKVLVSATDAACLPAVQVQTGLSVSPNDWEWIMGLGKKLPSLPVFDSEMGSFRGDFKSALKKLRESLAVEDLGFVYDTPVTMTDKSGARTTIIPCVCKMDESRPFEGYQWVEHEAFENACYKRFDGKDTDASPCKPPDKNAEFNPFAPNPVGFRWFKGITLFEENVSKVPDKGVYLGVFKVLSAPTGFKIMVNEHNRVNIPIIFLTESQLSPEEKTWMHGVRTREEKFNIDLLEGGNPNLGWLGPEMSGEEGATFKEKLDWAIREAKANMNIPDASTIGKQYDKELIFMDENDNVQLLLYGELAKDPSDCLPGHIWVEKQQFLRENMKYYCPMVLDSMVTEQQKLVNDVLEVAAKASGGLNIDAVAKVRAEKAAAVTNLKEVLKAQTPLKWVDRVIMWCADKMPSFTKDETGADANACVASALAKAKDIEQSAKERAALVAKYKK